MYDPAALFTVFLSQSFHFFYFKSRPVKKNMPLNCFNKLPSEIFVKESP